MGLSGTGRCWALRAIKMVHWVPWGTPLSPADKPRSTNACSGQIWGGEDVQWGRICRYSSYEYPTDLVKKVGKNGRAGQYL